MSSRSSVTHASTLLDQLPLSVSSPTAWQTVQALSVLFLAALTAASAQLSFPLPFTPVPFTLQPMVVLVGAAALGARLGALSQVLYLLVGMAGLPVFALSPDLPPGAMRLLGPTGGYLLAFPLAAFVTGWLAERGMDRRYLTSVVAMFAGLSTIFVGGVAWLAMTVGVPAALAAGLYPFIVVDLIKIVAAGLVLPTVWRVMRAG